MASSLPAATEAKPSRNIVVLISGSGTNLQALIDAAPSFNARITHVISSKSSAHGLHRATKAGIPTHVHSMLKYKTPNQRITLEQRQKFDMDLGDFIEKLNPDLIVLAGWMLILGKEFVHRFEGKIINLHPSLPGDIVGANAIGRAYEEFKQGLRRETGVMVHYVIPEVDEGKPIVSQKVEIKEGDSLEDLEARIHKAEHQLLPQATRMVLDGTAPPFK